MVCGGQSGRVGRLRRRFRLGEGVGLCSAVASSAASTVSTPWRNVRLTDATRSETTHWLSEPGFSPLLFELRL